MKIGLRMLSSGERRRLGMRQAARRAELLFARVSWSIALGFLGFPLQVASALPAFPDAEGSGALAKGGRGGVVCEVTSLNDSGPGSLRACAEMSGPRTVIFRVSGTIVLKSRIRITNPYVTIAGQTAPGGGIQITFKNPGTIPDLGSSGPSWQTVLNNERPTIFRVETHDVIIRYLRLRPGYVGYCSSCPGTGIADAMYIVNASTNSSRDHVENVILDHVSIMWGSNMNLHIRDVTGGRRVQNITVQNSIIAEPLYGRNQTLIGYSKTQSETAGDKMWDIDLHRNLFSTSFSRMPLISSTKVRWTNNINYNTQTFMLRVGSANPYQVDIVGNIFDHGPAHSSSSRGHYEIGVATPQTEPATVFVSGNKGDRHGDDNHNMVALVGSPASGDQTSGPAPDHHRRSKPLPKPVVPVNVIDVNELEGRMLPRVGASQRLDCEGNWVFNRDAADSRVIEEGFRKRAQNFLVTHEDQVGGYPVLEKGEPCVDSSGDGIPDAWLIRNDLNPKEAIGARFHGSGYTFLELYLNGMQVNAQPQVAPAAAPTGVLVQ